MTETADLFSLGFVALLTVVFATRGWLLHRQVRHVAAHRGRVPTAFEGVVSLPTHQKAADYALAKARLESAQTLLNTTLVLGWTVLGGVNALNQGLLTTFPAGLLQQLALLAAFVLVGSVVDLPLAWYRTFVLEQRFGFNHATLGQWITDGIKGTAVTIVLGLPLATLVLWLMDVAGSTWWLWAWGVYMGFSLLMMWAYPTVIAPWFNTFQPMEDAALQSRVSALMVRCGFQPNGFFVMDGSRRSAHSNAYFTGTGRTKRVVFYDTLLAQLNPAELEAVLAHELGHFHHNHLHKRLRTMAALTLGAFALLGWLSTQTWFYVGLGVEPQAFSANHALALLLFTLILPLPSFFLAPLMAASSRRDEFQADRFAMEHTPAVDLKSALVKLYEGNASTLTPDPCYVAFYHSHPPAGQRLARLTP
jgi:STE24 endopeptidase